MTSAWRILGLAPGASLDDVKAAYARLIRQHRPDQDPAGFRRVHDAYRWLRDALERQPDAAADGWRDAADRDADGEEPEPGETAAAPDQEQPGTRPPGQTPARPPRRRLTPERLLARLDRARAAADSGAEIRTWRRVVWAWRAQRGVDSAWDDMLLEQLRQHPDAVLFALTGREPGAALARGDDHVASAILTALAAHGAWDTLGLALGDLERRVATGGERRTWLAGLLDAALLLAPMDPEGVRRAVDGVFPRLQADQREQLPPIERRILVGEELQLLPTQTRQDVAMVLADPDAEIAPPRRRVLAAVVRNESVPLTARLLVELFPHLGALIPETPRPLPATPSRRMPGWVIVLVLLVGRNVANLFRDPSPKPSAPPRREAGWYPVRESDPALRSPAHDGSTDDQRRGAGPASAPASRPGRR